MKKMKKTISLILALIMLLSVAPLQIFAAAPVLEKVEFIDNTPISNQDVQRVFAYNPEDTEQVLFEAGNDYRYYYKLYFSNGYTLNNLEGNFQNEYWLCGVKNYFVETYVDPVACQKAIDDGKSTVKVTVCVELERNFGKTENYKFEVEKEITEGFLKSARLIGDMPENIVNGGYIANAFNGREIELEYYDGRKETCKIVCEDEEETPFCYIKGELAILDYVEDSYYDEEIEDTVFYKGITIDYLDASTEIVRVEKICPFLSIELLDYKLDGKGGITEVTYRLTCEDGRVIEKTCSIKSGKNEHGKAIVDTVDGYEVTAYLLMESTYYDIMIEIEDIWRVFDWVDGEDIKDACDCICHRNGFLYLVSLFLIKIWKLFGAKEYCQCGYLHW